VTVDDYHIVIDDRLVAVKLFLAEQQVVVEESMEYLNCLI
jgi:hypothetical protein